jgi:2-polyprenyl-6-methoxyphenol hydroxylase-like FAD-dependent oxidoreductase
MANDIEQFKETMQKTGVVIVGGGPAGLMLAIELGCRDVPCIVLEEDVGSPDFPKANATSARTMEHFRRRGFAKEVRALGLTADHPQDIVYCGRLAEKELTRFLIPSRQQVADRTAFGDYGEDTWPTPELPHRAQQMMIEPVLREQALKYKSVQLMCGWRAESFQPDSEGVTLAVKSTVNEASLNIRGSYMVGCDGPRSLVRKSCGIVFEGHTDGDRDFFGGQMLSVYFSSSDLYTVLGKKKAWMYWAVNAQQRGMLVAIDGVDKFLFALQLKPGQTEESVDFRAAAFAAIGAQFDLNLIGVAPWFAGFTLVAERFAKDRVFIAGDAAHLFTPTGGMGYNTSVDDAVNLGWKLAAVLNGWASEKLLATYESERKPIAQRNTAFARLMADSIGMIKPPAELQEQGAVGDAARTVFGEALNKHVRTEFNIPGLQLGLRYNDSAIVAAEESPIPEDKPNLYIPSAKPGGRAPHLWINGTSIFDLFGKDFTLLYVGSNLSANLSANLSDLNNPNLQLWQQCFAARGVPLYVLQVDNAEALRLYQSPLVLIRPDHHVAWRGDSNCAEKDVHRVLAMICADQ